MNREEKIIRKRIVSKKYRLANKEKVARGKKRWAEDNKEKEKKRKAKKYIDNKKAKCVICGKSANKTYCSKECQYKGHIGERNIFWLGGKSYEIYSKEWTNTFKRDIRERDGHMCMICNRHRDEFNRAMDVHHIDGDKQNTIVENCISLCLRHHMIVERSGPKKYTFWMPKFQKMLNKIHGYEYSHLITEKEVIKV